MTLDIAADRADRLLAGLERAGVDALLVTEPIDLRYMTGYTGTNGLAVIGPEIRAFLTDFRYVEQAAEEVDPSYERVCTAQDLLGGLPSLLSGRNAIRRLGFDDAQTSVRTRARLGEILDERIALVAAGGVVERLRRRKDPDEVERIASAQALADDAFEALLANGLVGRTERSLALWLETAMRERGASGPSFPSIIAAGGHGALPHAQPRDVAVPADTLLVIDWGAVLDGYCSDCTRTVATGEGIGERAREAYALVLRAQQAGLEAYAAGRDAADIDGVPRGIIAEAGYGEYFGHGLGHGVGLDIHEAPVIRLHTTDVLAAGDVVSCEPGVYLPGRFGIRIEDLVVIGEDGPASNRILTGLTKELCVVE